MVITDFDRSERENPITPGNLGTAADQAAPPEATDTTEPTTDSDNNSDNLQDDPTDNPDETEPDQINNETDPTESGED